MMRAKKNPVGRPRKAPKGTRIRCELAPAEYRAFMRACRKCGLSQNLLSREIILAWLRETQPKKWE